MPNRTITEAICASRILDSLTPEEERLFGRLKVHCDDFGRFNGSAVVIIGRCFPRLFEQGTVTAPDVERWLQGLDAKGAVHLYTVDDERYLYVDPRVWEQTPRAKASKYPAPPPVGGNGHQQAQTTPDGSADLPPEEGNTGNPAPTGNGNASGGQDGAEAAGARADANSDGEIDGFAQLVGCQEHYRGGAVVRESDKRKVRQILEEAQAAGVGYLPLLTVMKDLQLRSRQADPPDVIERIGYYMDAWRDKIAEVAAATIVRTPTGAAHSQTDTATSIIPFAARSEPKPLTTDDIQ